MMLEVLSPAMQHAEQTDIGSKVLRVASDFEQRGSTGTEEQIVEQARMSLTEWVQRMRQSKDDMEVGHGKQVLLTSCEPVLARLGLALRAVPVAARNGVHSITCLMGSVYFGGVRAMNNAHSKV